MNTLNDLLNASSAALQDQIARWSAMIQKMRDRSYSTDQWLSDIVGMWDSWLSLLTVPAQLGRRTAGELPSVLLIVDGVAQTVGPTAVSANISLPPGVTLEWTELHHVGGDSVIGKEYVQPRLLPDGNSVEVRLVNLGSDKDHIARRLKPGLYVGSVYARELATYRPLALVYVLITEPGAEPVTAA